MKIKFGDLVRVDGSATEEIIVKSALPNKAKDILIGGGITLVGVVYLCYTAFKNGVDISLYEYEGENKLIIYDDKQSYLVNLQSLFQ